MQRLFGKSSPSTKEFKGKTYKLHRSPEYMQEAEDFERRLGVYAYHHAKSRSAADAALGKMKDYLLQGAGADNAMYKQAMAGAFGRQDPKSAGQVGQVFDAVEKVFSQGNLREKMTAYYNSSLSSFKVFTTDLVNESAWGKAGSEGLDVKGLKERKSWRDSSKRRVLGWAERQIRGRNDALGKDLFAKDISEFSKGGQDRDKLGPMARVWQGKTSERTVGDLGQMPLSGREKASMFGSRATDDLTDEPLPWIEGKTNYTVKTKSGWYKQIHDKLGMPVVAGPSGTTDRLFDTFKWLKVSSPPADFRLALLGWMLTSQDHSFHEIMSMAATKGVNLPYVPGPAAYHSVAPLPLPELRDKVAKGREFPDEIVYHKEIEKGGTALAGDEDLDAYQTAKKKGTNESKALAAHMSPGSGAAVSAYTGASYLVQNPMLMTMPEFVKKYWIKHQIKEQDELKHLKSEMKSGKLSVTALMNEAKLHNRMLYQALLEMPAWQGTVYRGDWTLAPWKWGKGATTSFATFTSTSTDRDTAKSFTEGKPGKILFEMTVTNGRSVDLLSYNQGEDEILLPPGSSFVVTDKPAKAGGILEVKMRQEGGAAAATGPQGGAEENESSEEETSEEDSSSEEAAPPTGNAKILAAFKSFAGYGDLINTAALGPFGAIKTEVTLDEMLTLDPTTKAQILALIGCDADALNDAMEYTYGDPAATIFSDTPPVVVTTPPVTGPITSATVPVEDSSGEESEASFDEYEVFELIEGDLARRAVTLPSPLPHTKGQVPAGTMIKIVGTLHNDLITIDVANAGRVFVTASAFVAATRTAIPEFAHL